MGERVISGVEKEVRLAAGEGVTVGEKEGEGVRLWVGVGVPVGSAVIEAVIEAV